MRHRLCWLVSFALLGTPRATVRFVAELPPRACINQLIISPTWNRMYVGGLENPKP